MARGVNQTGLLDLPNELLELIIGPFIENGWNWLFSFEKKWLLSLKLVCS